MGQREETLSLLSDLVSKEISWGLGLPLSGIIGKCLYEDSVEAMNKVVKLKHTLLCSVFGEEVVYFRMSFENTNVDQRLDSDPYFTGRVIIEL